MHLPPIQGCIHIYTSIYLSRPAIPAPITTVTLPVVVPVAVVAAPIPIAVAARTATPAATPAAASAAASALSAPLLAQVRADVHLELVVQDGHVGSPAGGEVVAATVAPAEHARQLATVCHFSKQCTCLSGNQNSC